MWKWNSDTDDESGQYTENSSSYSGESSDDDKLVDQSDISKDSKVQARII